MYNSTTACSGNGKCIRSEMCLCYPGFSGKYCDTRPYGIAYTAGRNSRSQLGDSFAVDKYTLTRPLGWYTFQYINQVAAGELHSLTLTITGQMHSFGDNTYDIICID